MLAYGVQFVILHFNFLVETGINLILSTVIVRVLDIVKKPSVKA